MKKKKHISDPIGLVRANILGLSPYSTARDEYEGPLGVYLDANENPYETGVNRYPDPRQRELKKILSGIKGVPGESIFIGNGSDEPIDLVYRVFCEPGKDNAVSITPTYAMYRVAAEINDVEFREVGLKQDFSLDVPAILAAADGNSKLLFLCSPNNPTANLFPASEIERLIDEFPGMVVLDEAYIDFAQDEGFLGRLDEFANLIVLQTLSKAWGMAGLRLGLAFARADIVELMNRVKYPYNINVVTQKMVAERLAVDISGQIREIISGREKLLDKLTGIPFIERVFPSDANFILVKVPEPRALYDHLIDRGVIVRDRSRMYGCEGCLRLTVGTPEENVKLLEALKGFEAKE